MLDISLLLAVAASQEGVVTLRQCLQAGVSRSAVRNLVNTGRWQRVHQGVYATTNGVITEDATLRAALLAVGDDAMVSHETSLWLARRIGQLPRPIHLSVPTLSGATAPAGVRLHRLERLTALGSPPRMTVERATLEVVHLHSNASRVVTIVCDQIGGRLTTPPRLLEEMSRRPRQRWRRLLDDMLVDVAVGAQSTLELADLRNDRDHGLPAGVRQARFRAGGESRWLDVLISLGPDGPAVVKELDGRLGHEGVARFRDMRRDNAGVLSGASQLRFGWSDFANDRCEVAALQALLWRRLRVRKTGHECRQRGCGFEQRVTRLERTYPAMSAFRAAS